MALLDAVPVVLLVHAQFLAAAAAPTHDGLAVLVLARVVDGRLLERFALAFHCGLVYFFEDGREDDVVFDFVFTGVFGAEG